MAIREGESAILRPPSSQNPVLVYDNPLLDPPKDGKINFKFSPFEMRNSAPFGELLNFELFNQQSRLGPIPSIRHHVLNYINLTSPVGCLAML